MINGGILFIVAVLIWITYGIAKDYEAQAKQKDNTDKKENEKKEGKKHV